MRVISEGPTKITRATIDAAWRKRKTGDRLIIRDKDCRGLALIVNATSMAWSCAYRPRGADPMTGRRWANRTVTLGNPETHSPDAARAATNRIKGQAASGGDPAEERKARAEAALRKRGSTLMRLLSRCTATSCLFGPSCAELAYPPRTTLRMSWTQVHLALVEMKVEMLPAADLTVSDIRRLLGAVVEGASSKRARFGALSRFLDWCQDARYIQANPCVLIPVPGARGHLSLAQII